MDIILGRELRRSYLVPCSDVWLIRLCVIDPEPREEFSPRERHTLKEFAVNIFLTFLTLYLTYTRRLRCGKWSFGEKR